MSKEPIGFVADPDSRYDRFVMALFGICFQLAEVMLVVGAFQYAGTKTGSLLLHSIATVLGLVGSLWLGLVLPGTIGRLEFWKKTSSRIRLYFALVMMGLGVYGGFLYLQAIAALARSQT